MRVLEVVGSDILNFECPRCGAHDRERHLSMYLDATGLMAGIGERSILHFAPERRLSSRIEGGHPRRYVRCDLYPSSPDVLRVDMLAMQFADRTFDLVIANHVLEHVADDGKALSEIRRVLAPGGFAILQTPFSRKLRHTWEDSGIGDEPARLLAFGQEDHVRLYGADIFDRFAAHGFDSRVRAHDEVLPNIDVLTTGVNREEPFFLFQRPLVS